MFDAGVGEGTNVDSHRGDVVRLVIAARGDHNWVHGCGVCKPGDCDWGEVSLNVCEMLNVSGQLRAIAIWTKGFKGRVMTL